MKLYWSEDKSRKLKEIRNIDFEEIESLLKNGGNYTIEDHPNKEKYPHQKILYVMKDDYIIAIPCVKHEDGYFCKTLFLSRKATKQLLNTSHYAKNN